MSGFQCNSLVSHQAGTCPDQHEAYSASWTSQPWRMVVGSTSYRSARTRVQEILTPGLGEGA